MNISLQRNILSMKYSGHAPEDISAALDVPLPAVMRILDRAISLSADNVRSTFVRESELLVLQQLEDAYLPRALEGDISSAAYMLRLMERRSTLLGLDRSAPVLPPPPRFSRITVKIIDAVVEATSEDARVIN
jgi:hypothetical protein